MIVELAMNLDAKKRLFLKAKDRYYQGKPIMTDKQFDDLEDEIREVDPKWLKGKTGAPIKNKKTKIKLPVPMFSLDKKKPENVDPWLDEHTNEQVTISDKLDGAALEIVYVLGVPTQAVTRGNGIIGGDVSYLIPHMKIPKRVGKDSFIVRCEGLFSHAAFNKYKTEFDAARNAASGILNRQDIHPAVRDLSVVVLQVLQPSTMRPSKALTWAKSKGFTVVPYKVFKASQLNSTKLSKLLDARLAKSKFRMDGLVITLDKINQNPKSGNPEWAVAFKKNVAVEDAPIATVKKVLWEVSPHGYLKPVIEYSPIQVDGATLRNATAYNAKYVQDNKIGPGAQVRIVRSGEIIPKVVEVVKKAQKGDLPKQTDFGAYKWTEKGVDIVLVNPKENADFRVKVITRFFEKVDADFMREGTVRKLYAAGFDNVRKIVQAKASDFLRVPGVKSATANKLYEAIHKVVAKGVPIVTLMNASGTFPRGMGETRLQQVVDQWPILKVLKACSIDPDRAIRTLQKLPGWSDKTASAFVRGAPKFVKWVKVTGIKPITKKAPPPKTKTNKLKGIGVCWTGYRSADEEQAVTENGGQVVSFGSKTQVLLYRAGGKESSKLDKARAKGIPVMTWDQFSKKYGV